MTWQTQPDEYNVECYAFFFLKRNVKQICFQKEVRATLKFICNCDAFMFYSNFIFCSIFVYPFSPLERRRAQQSVQPSNIGIVAASKLVASLNIYHV